MHITECISPTARSVRFSMRSNRRHRMAASGPVLRPSRTAAVDPKRKFRTPENGRKKSLKQTPRETDQPEGHPDAR